MRRREARFQHARALRHDRALSRRRWPFLRESTGPARRGELLLALAGAGRGAEAIRWRTRCSRATTRRPPWDSLIVTLGRPESRMAADAGRSARGAAGHAPQRRSRAPLRGRAAAAAGRHGSAPCAGCSEAAAVPGDPRAASARLSSSCGGTSRGAQSVEALAPSPTRSARWLTGGERRRREAAQLLARGDRACALRRRFGAGRRSAGRPPALSRRRAARDSLAAPALAGELFRRIVDRVAGLALRAQGGARRRSGSIPTGPIPPRLCSSSATTAAPTWRWSGARRPTATGARGFAPAPSPRRAPVQPRRPARRRPGRPARRPGEPRRRPRQPSAGRRPTGRRRRQP